MKREEQPDDPIHVLQYISDYLHYCVQQMQMFRVFGHQTSEFVGFLNRIIHFVGNRQTKGEDGDGYYHTQKISWIKCSQSFSLLQQRGESEIYHLLTLIAKQKQMCCIPDSAQLHSSDSTMLYMSHPHFYAILQWPPGGPSSFSGQEKQYI